MLVTACCDSEEQTAYVFLQFHFSLRLLIHSHTDPQMRWLWYICVQEEDFFPCSVLIFEILWAYDCLSNPLWSHWLQSELRGMLQLWQIWPAASQLLCNPNLTLTPLSSCETWSSTCDWAGQTEMEGRGEQISRQKAKGWGHWINSMARNFLNIP